MSKITTTIQKYIDIPISLTNEALYELCKNKGKYVWGNGHFFGEKIWLIGRSYAASPERRYVKKPGFTDELELDNIGDGTGKYFEEIGNYIVKDPRYERLISIAKVLQTGYKFDGSSADLELLETSIKAVELLNQMVKDASREYDSKYNPKIVNNVNYKNQISFCSKFLHFHCPHTVFIIDHFTKQASHCLFSMRSKKQLHIDDTDITTDFKQGLQKYLPKITNVFSQEVEAYIEHCKRSYALGCYIKQSNILNKNKIVYYPRTIDTILQNVKS